MKLHNDLEQGSEEWLKIRLGKFTASQAQAISAKGKGLETLIFEKVAEILTGKQKFQYVTNDMERGNELESMARDSYEIETGRLVKQVGFVELDEHTGCSPDGLVDEDGLVEIKCPNDAIFVRYLHDKKIDPAYVWQMQMQMLVTGREWVDFVVFNPNLPKMTSVVRVDLDEVATAKITAGLAFGIQQLKSVLDEVKNGK